MNNAPPLPDNASDRVRLANEANFRPNRLSTSTSGSRNSAPMSIVSSTASEHGGRNGASFGPLDHRTKCKSCRQPIVGVRYQCATCPSSPSAYSLVGGCLTIAYPTKFPTRSVRNANRKATSFMIRSIYSSNCRGQSSGPSNRRSHSFHTCEQSRRLNDGILNIQHAQIPTARWHIP